MEHGLQSLVPYAVLPCGSWLTAVINLGNLGQYQKCAAMKRMCNGLTEAIWFN